MVVAGYHGTDIKHTESIRRNGFAASGGDHHWLGDGAYFFTEGLPPSPEENAEKWAVAQAWDKLKAGYAYTKFAVIKVLIEVEKEMLLDLTTMEGQTVFEYLRRKFILKIAAAGYKTAGYGFKDGEIINIARQEGIIEADVVKGNFYIKFRKERIFNINFRMPNATVCAVFDTSKNIKTEHIHIIKTGGGIYETDQ